MGYLDNEICELQPLYKYDPKVKYNVYSMGLFKINKPYKDFNKFYIGGLRKLISYLDQNINDYYARIFIDQNVLNDESIMLIMRSHKKIQPVLFKCSDYMSGMYHYDLFGTMLRYFPAFDFPNNDTNIVYSIDIDLSPSDLANLKFFQYPKVDKYSKCSIGGTKGSEVVKLLLKPQNLPNVLGGALLIQGKHDKNIILDFIKSAHLIKDTYIYNERHTPFGFGVDELFINKYWIKKAIYGDIGIQSYYSPSYFLYCLKKGAGSLIPDERLFSNALVYTMGDHYKKGMSSDDMIGFMDKYYYKDTSNFTGITFQWNETNNYFTKRFQEYVDYSYKNNIYWINAYVLKLIFKYQRNIVMSMCVYEYSIKTKLVKRLINIDIVKLKI
jgi:hypothetical protein